MKIKTSELKGAALDYAVAVCENIGVSILETKRIVFDMNMYPMVANQYSFSKNGLQEYKPSSSWSQAGPIIDREIISVHRFNGDMWSAEDYSGDIVCDDECYLQAAMRCYVASKLGNEVEIPEELI